MSDEIREREELKYYDIYGTERSLYWMVKNAPGWTHSRMVFYCEAYPRLEAENKKLRKALEAILNHDSTYPTYQADKRTMKLIAKQALKDGD